MKKRQLLRRLINRAARFLVDRCRVPASYVGYRYLVAESPKDYIERVGKTAGVPRSSYRCLDEESAVYGSLPRNVNSRDELTRSKHTHTNVQRWPFSFHDVAERKACETFVVTIPDCRIATWSNEYGDPFSAIINKDHRLLKLRGMGFDAEHARVFRAAKDIKHLHRAAWVLEYWYRNYHHWLIYHLPKIMLLSELGFADQIVLPPDEHTSPVIEASIRALGLEPLNLPKADSSIITVTELTVVGMDYFHGPLLRKVRDKIAGPTLTPPFRRILISRLSASRRQLDNEEDIWSVLEPFGFERVILENLNFTEQVNLLKQTAVLVGVHGAGLANMLFAPTGAHILEISDRSFPAPDYYALANSLGHHYWVTYGYSPSAIDDPGYHNLIADPTDIGELVSRIDSYLSVHAVSA